MRRATAGHRGKRGTEERSEELAAGKHYPHIMTDFIAAHTVQIVVGVFAFIFIIVILAIVAAVRAGKRRSENLREWSFRSGYNFTPGPMPALELAPLELFEVKGETVEANARNVASSSRMTLFDFDHATRHSSGVMNNHTTYVRKTISSVLFKLDEPLPRFTFAAMSTAGSDSLTGKLMSATLGVAKFVGGHRPGILIPIDDRPGFLLHSDDDPERVKPFFIDARQFFDDKCGWTVQSFGSWLYVLCDPTIYKHGWEENSSVSPKNYDEFANMAQLIREHFRA
jgi:hypothetical protein